MRAREARPADLARLLQLYGGLEPLSGEAAERRFAEVLADPRQRVLVAEEEGAGVAGTLTLVVVPNLAHGGEQAKNDHQVGVVGEPKRSAMSGTRHEFGRSRERV